MPDLQNLCHCQVPSEVSIFLNIMVYGGKEDFADLECSTCTLNRPCVGFGNLPTVQAQLSGMEFSHSLPACFLLLLALSNWYHLIF